MSEPYWASEDGDVTLYLGDCLDVLAAMETASINAVVTDPPYELGFMGRSWDASGIAYNVSMWRECLRVLKPGGHLLAFGGTRTWHRLACAIEDAGFEIRDSIDWLYGTGFPKSLDVSKAIDKAAGAEREIVGSRDRYRDGGERQNRGNVNNWGETTTFGTNGVADVTAPATEDAARWDGWGTALKPAHEPIVVARKPLAGTVAANVLEWGTGALNIAACRVGDETVSTHSRGRNTAFPKRPGETTVEESGRTQRQDGISLEERSGRWPPNVLLSEEAAAEMDRQSGMLTSGTGAVKRASAKGGAASASIGAESRSEGTPMLCYGDTGGASRFFPVFRYEAKAAASERPRTGDGTAHPTVKPVDLMAWLVRLVTPPGGLILDLFAGSGTTAEACIVEGFRCVLIEKDPSSAELIKTRLSKPIQPAMFGLEAS